jgi:hypothetical protein
MSVKNLTESQAHEADSAVAFLIAHGGMCKSTHDLKLVAQTVWRCHGLES